MSPLVTSERSLKSADGQIVLVRAYRDFFWRMAIDPTKTRPSAEALLRRVLQGREFPRVNTLVDVYNVVSMKNIVPIAAFDADRLVGDLVMRFARKGEKFSGIGWTSL
ncbi:MAG: phenylalanine--tRNA ligase beta subunit-related protein [Nitrososphaerota archaeon]